MEKKFIDYLKTLKSNPRETFIICVNANCESFKKADAGDYSEETMEDLTFFRVYAHRILNTEKAIDILKNAELLRLNKEKGINNEDVLFCTVNYEGNYPVAKAQLRELLN